MNEMRLHEARNSMCDALFNAVYAAMETPHLSFDWLALDNLAHEALDAFVMEARIPEGIDRSKPGNITLLNFVNIRRAMESMNWTITSA